MAKLKRYKLINIQSWHENSDWVELDDTLMNIIIGRNETGKSVLYKVLAQMFIPSQFGSSRRDLVRDGYSFGLALFELDTGVNVIFKVNINNTQEYQIIYPDGHKVTASGDEPPVELAQEFNWFVDTKEGVILNLLHKDTNLPFIRTSKTFNAQLMKFLNEDPRVESIKEVFMANADRLKEAMKVVTTNMDKVRYRYDAIEYIDVEQKKNVLERCEELQQVWGDFLGVLEGARALTILPNPPREKFTAPAIKGFIEAIPVMMDAERAIQSLSENLDKVPEEGDYSRLPQLKALAEYEGSTTQISEWSSRLLESLRSIPEQGDYSSLDKLAILSKLEKGTQGLIVPLQALMQALMEVLTDNSEELEMQLRRLEEYKDSWTGNHRLMLSAASVLQGLLQAEKSAKSLKQFDEEILKMQKELGVCPTCGRSFK